MVDDLKEYIVICLNCFWHTRTDNRTTANMLWENHAPIHETTLEKQQWLDGATALAVSVRVTLAALLN